MADLAGDSGVTIWRSGWYLRQRCGETKPIGEVENATLVRPLDAPCRDAVIGAVVAVVLRAGVGPGLSDPPDHANRAVSGRRWGRRGRAHRRGETVDRARPAGRDRQSRWGGRSHRHARRGARRARRLHARDGTHRDHLDQSDALRQSGLRPAQGFHADRAHRLNADRDHGASVIRTEDARRRDRAREGATWQAQHRHAAHGHRRISRGRAVQGDGGRRRHHRALQGHRAAHQRPARQPGADRLQRDGARDGQPSGRHAARDRGARARPLQPVAGRADRCRVGAAGVRGHASLRPPRARRYAEADRHAAQHGAAQARSPPTT